MVRIIPRLKSHNSNSQPPSRNQSRGPSPMRGGASTLLLRTTVIKGRNLAAKDRSGTSDPYLVITHGDTKQSTHTVNKTLNPEWNVSFDLPVVGPQSLLLEAVCWDRDRFGKDYLGEFDIAVEDIFLEGSTTPAPRWHTLKSTRTGSGKKNKDSIVSGEIQLQFALVDVANPSATHQDLLHKFMATTTDATNGSEETFEDEQGQHPLDSREDEEEDELLTSDEADGVGSEKGTSADAAEKKRKKIKLRRLKRKSKARAYEFGGSGCVGIVYLEIGRITDLPPERNVTRTSFDMDPFVVASLGRKTYRTRVIRHNLNPVFDEKMIFQVMRHEQNFSLSFSVVDRDKLSGNDFIGTTTLPLPTIIQGAPDPDPETGLYRIKEPQEPAVAPQKSSRFRLPLSRSSSSQSLNTKANKLPIPTRGPTAGQGINLAAPVEGVLPQSAISAAANDPTTMAPLTHHTVHSESNGSHPATMEEQVSNSTQTPSSDDPDFKPYILPLDLKNKEKWNDKHPAQLQVRAKYLPYPALIQQFWRAMLKQYDADESGKISKVELTTMLDTLGSTLKETTIDQMFDKFPQMDSLSATEHELTVDQVIMCLEDQLRRAPAQKKTFSESLSGMFNSHSIRDDDDDPQNYADQRHPGDRSAPIYPSAPINQDFSTTDVPLITQEFVGEPGEDAAMLGKDDLAAGEDEEHIIEIRECPICHQPRLNKRSDADIIAHIATCASQDWRQVNNIVMAGFVTSSQAQRKWYSKVITKVSYGGYKLGANSANILVQDRITGQINEERMSVYVRLGIRLLYKGLHTRDMEKKRIRKLLRSLSVKQGRKYDDPASVREIPGFIAFHKLDMSELLHHTDKFRTFNEFFYRELKHNARPCSAPQNPGIVTSPADSRSVVFDSITDATRIWVKGRNFSVERLIGKAYPEDAKRFVNGAMGIMRLAPQDYHRFHIPVDGVMGQPKLIDGEYYTVNPMAIRSSLDVYGENIRVIVPIDSVSHGRVMVVCVGAMMVGSTVITRKAGEKVARAEELGYFKFGGSTIIVLFEKGKMLFDSDMIDNSNGAVETLIRVGMSIGHHPDTPQHVNDMRKKEENITNEDRQEAKRRIEGSLAPSLGSLEDVK